MFQYCLSREALNQARAPRLESPMLDWSTCPAVERNADRLNAAWVFRGTRVPLSALFENLQGGASVEQFVAWFPGVTPLQVDGVLEHAARSAKEG